MQIKNKLVINLLAIFACFLWSTAFVGIKAGLEYTTPLQFAGIRFFLAGLMILPFINFKKAYNELRENLPFIIKVAIFQTFFQYAFFYLGVARVSGALSAVIIGAGPLFIAIMAHFMMPDDKLTLKKTIGIIVGLAGIVLFALTKESNYK